MIDKILIGLAVILGITSFIIDSYIYLNYKDENETYDRTRGFYTFVVVGNGFGKEIPKHLKRLYFISLASCFVLIIIFIFLKGK